MNQTTTKTDTFIDPICGMAVNPKTTRITATIEGQTDYFCAEGCRETFIKNPHKHFKPKPRGKKGLWGRYLERLKKATGGKAMTCH